MIIRDRLINLFNHNGCLTINDSPLLTYVDIENDGVLKIYINYDEEGKVFQFEFNESSLETAREKDGESGTFILKDNIGGEDVEIVFFRLEKLK